MIRWIGFDAHKHYAFVVELCGGDRLEYRVSLPSGLQDFKSHLSTDVHLVMEASTNSFRIADELLPHVGRLVVAHPAQTRGAVAHAANNDRNAAEALARLLASGFVREVWLPPAPVRHLRSLIELRIELSRLRVRGVNRLRALLTQELVATRGRQALSEEWVSERIPQHLHVQAYSRSMFEQKAFLELELAKIDKLLLAWSKTSEDARLVMSVPGIGPVIAACVLAQVGDIKRFETPGRLCSYAGLVPRVHDSGTVRRTGGITRAGRSSLRWAMGVAAMSASRYCQHFKDYKERLRQRRPRAVALTACARKLLVVVWHVLTSRRPFQDEKVERHRNKLQRLDTGRRKGRPRTPARTTTRQS